MTVRRFAYICFAVAFVLLAVGARALPVSPHTTVQPAQSASAQAAFDPDDATTTPGYYSVVRVVDGDTIVVWKDGEPTRPDDFGRSGEEITVRLIGMDTPETLDPRKPVECWGPEASAEGKKLMAGKDVRLVVDPTQDKYDKYGRMLAYVYLPAQAGLPNGLFYNKFMIAEGYAHEYTYKKAYQFQKEFKSAQAEAKASKKGFWSPATCNGNTGVNSATTSIAH